MYSFNQNRLDHQVERVMEPPRRSILLIPFELSNCDRSVMYSSLYMHNTALPELTTRFVTKVRWPFPILDLRAETNTVRVCTSELTSLVCYSLLIPRSFEMNRQEVWCSYTKPIFKFNLPPSKLAEIMASPSSDTPTRKPRKKSMVRSIYIVSLLNATCSMYPRATLLI